MSEYVICDSPMIKSLEHLKKALVDLGVKADHIEQHEFPVPLVGYQGDKREQKAHVVIRRSHVGTASNDIGFEILKDGIRIIVSDYDKSHGLGKHVLPMSKGGSGMLESAYAKSIVETQLISDGFSISTCEKKQEKIKIRLAR